jgi:hypothetical protein
MVLNFMLDSLRQYNLRVNANFHKLFSRPILHIQHARQLVCRDYLFPLKFFPLKHILILSKTLAGLSGFTTKPTAPF